jgi:Kef-type K+ transport system membrane component KefB
MLIAGYAIGPSSLDYAIEGIEWPFLNLFFILAGASLDARAIEALSLLGSAYIVLRITGRVIGARVGSRTAGAEPEIGKWLGVALLPQAGIPIGLALHVSQTMAELAHAILPIVLGTTVVFELIGPAATKAVLTRTSAGPL